MNEHPILFSGAMVRAILKGRKSKTRRVIKPQPPHWKWNHDSFDERCINVSTDDDNDGYYVICPYGKPGDRLWVKETWAHDDLNCKDVKCGNRDHIWWKAHEKKIVADSFAGDARWRSSRFMPRWASRITLEIMTVHVERLWEISAGDAMAEGIYVAHGSASTYIDTFMLLWNSINEKRGFGWDVNPWVWVIEFKVVNNGRE
jgi:hypothetical protein